MVIPCFHESGRIGLFLPDLCRAIDGIGNASVQVVDDGSGAEEAARMAAIVESLRLSHPCLKPLKILPENTGKGGAVYAGWADGIAADWLGFVDADGSCSAVEALRLIHRARSEEGGGRAMFGSRIKMLGRRVDRRWKRHLLGRVYATLVSEFLDIPVYDSQCGLKLVPRIAYQRIAQVLRLRRFAFDVELLVALLDSGCGVEEVPIDWHEVEGGKVRLLHDSVVMARDVIQIRGRRNTHEWQQATRHSTAVLGPLLPQ